MNNTPHSMSTSQPGTPLPVAYPVENHTHNTINITIAHPLNTNQVATPPRNLSTALQAIAAGLAAGIVVGAACTIADPQTFDASTFPIFLLGGLMSGLAVSTAFDYHRSIHRVTNTALAPLPVVNAQIDQSAQWANV